MNIMQQAPQTLAVIPLTHAGPTMRWRNEALRSHPTGRLILISKGQGRITVAGLTNGYGPNNLIFLPPQTMFGMEVGPTTHGQMLTVPDSTDWPSQPVHLRLLDAWLQKEAVHYLEQIEKELQPTGDVKAAHLWQALLAIFVRRQAQSQVATPNDSRRDSAAAKLVARYTQLIARDYRLDRGVGSYAAELGVTPTHLARCCQQIAGRSPLALLNARIHFEACVLLRDTAMPVNQIAELLGFQSAAYFTRSFQDQAKQTPTDFRRAKARTTLR